MTRAMGFSLELSAPASAAQAPTAEATRMTVRNFGLPMTLRNMRDNGQKSSYFYRARRSSQAGLKKRIQEIAATRVRYGYRRIHVLLATRRVAGQREACLSALCRDWPANPAQTAKAQGCRKTARDRRAPTAPNEVWAMDFLSDQLHSARTFPLNASIKLLSVGLPGLEKSSVTPFM